MLFPIKWGLYVFFSSKKQPMFRLLDFYSKLKQSEVVPHYCLFCRNITDTSYSFAEILQIHPTVLQKYYRHILQFCRNITDTSYSFAEILQTHPTVLQKYYRHILQFCRNITDTSYSFAEILQTHSTVLQKYYRHILQFCRITKQPCTSYTIFIK